MSGSLIHCSDSDNTILQQIFEQSHRGLLSERYLTLLY